VRTGLFKLALLLVIKSISNFGTGLVSFNLLTNEAKYGMI